MEGTNQVATVTPQAPSQMPTSSAPSVVSQPVMSQPQASQAYQVQAPQMQQVAPSAPAPQASAPAGNPWQEAFQALSASLNTSSPSQAQVPYSAYQTPTPQAASQVSFPSQQISAAPTYSPQVSTQAYSAPAYQPAQQQVEAPYQAEAAVSDGYLSAISDDSLEVLEHFGAEAPALLNTYACAVEDALIEQVQIAQNQSLMLEAAGEERGAMNLMLTNPDVLADYVNDFFGPNGPYPTPTAEEQHQIDEMVARQQFEAEIQAQEQQNAVPRNFQRPEMDFPTPGRQANVANDFWGGFSQMMDQNPEQAWQFLAQAPQGALQAKMLVQDS